MIEKKDWEKVLKDNEDQKELMIKSYNLTIPQFDAVINIAKQKISEFPEGQEDIKMAAEVAKDLGLKV